MQAAVAQRDRWTFRVLEGEAGQVAFVAEYDMGWQGRAVASSPTLSPCVTDRCAELAAVTPVLALDGDTVSVDVAFDYQVALARYRSHVVLACHVGAQGLPCRASKYAVPAQ